MDSMADQLNYKLIQFFLTGDDDLPAIYEVRLMKETKLLTCTCPGYRGRTDCKHIKFIRERLASSEERGHYVLKLDSETPEDVIDGISRMDYSEYRDFVAKYGMIEVL